MCREKEDEESANKLAKEEIAKRQKDKEDQIKRENAAKAQMKKLLLKQMEEDRSKQKQEELKVLHWLRFCLKFYFGFHIHAKTIFGG